MSHCSRFLTVSMAAVLAGAAVAQPAVEGSRAPSYLAAYDALPTDPAVHEGRLSNGMRYLILPNATPAGQVSIRLRFDAGSFHETDQQLGVAHFIEHMAFNGTRNVPEGEMVRMLERHGLSFGREIQATTSIDQTVYRFDIPASNAAKLDAVFLLMRELASEMLIEPEAIDRERGVILSEYRMQDVAALRAFRARDQFLYRDQLLPRRPPIGDPDILQAVTRPAMLDYYQRLYRPERATLIVVGDVDVGSIVSEIESRFGDWRGVGDAGAEPSYGEVRAGQMDVSTYTEAGILNQQVSATWLRPWAAPIHSGEAHRREVRGRLIASVLERRLQGLLDTGAAPFTAARVSVERTAGTATLTTISLDPLDGRFAETVAVMEREVRRLRTYGLDESETGRAAAAIRTDLMTATARSATQPSNTLADRLLVKINDGEPILSPAQELALFEEALRGFDGPEAMSSIEELFSGAGPLIFATAEAPITGGDAALREVYAESARFDVEPQPAVSAPRWAHEYFGEPSAVVEQRAIDDLGTTLVRFSNNVTLLVRPNSMRRNEVLVSARFKGGLSVLPPGATSFVLTQGEGAFVGGGLADLPLRDVREALTGKTFTTVFEAREDAFSLGGVTTPADLRTQLEVLTAYATKPGWRPHVYRQRQAEAEGLLGYIQATPINVALSQLGRILRSGDGRYTLPTREEATSTSLAALRSAIDPVLQSAPLEVLIVGDVTVDDAIRQTAATFGALPARDTDGTAALNPPRFPEPVEHRVAHGGSADAAVGIVAWETTDRFSDPRETTVLAVLQNVLRNRALDEIRERLGVAYSPVITSYASQTVADYGYLAILAEVAPTKVDVLVEAIAEIGADLRSRPISEDELARAVQPLLHGLATERAGNNYWRGALAGGSWNQNSLVRLRDEENRIRDVTAEDIQRAAQRYLDMDRAHRIVVLPETTQ